MYFSCQSPYKTPCYTPCNAYSTCRPCSPCPPCRTPCYQICKSCKPCEPSPSRKTVDPKISSFPIGSGIASSDDTSRPASAKSGKSVSSRDRSKSRGTVKDEGGTSRSRLSKHRNVKEKTAPPKSKRVFRAQEAKNPPKSAFKDRRKNNSGPVEEDVDKNVNSGFQKRMLQSGLVPSGQSGANKDQAGSKGLSEKGPGLGGAPQNDRGLGSASQSQKGAGLRDASKNGTGLGGASHNGTGLGGASQNGTGLAGASQNGPGFGGAPVYDRSSLNVSGVGYGMLPPCHPDYARSIPGPYTSRIGTRCLSPELCAAAASNRSSANATGRFSRHPDFSSNYLAPKPRVCTPLTSGFSPGYGSRMGTPTVNNCTGVYGMDSKYFSPGTRPPMAPDRSPNDSRYYCNARPRPHQEEPRLTCDPSSCFSPNTCAAATSSKNFSTSAFANASMSSGLHGQDSSIVYYQVCKTCGTIKMVPKEAGSRISALETHFKESLMQPGARCTPSRNRKNSVSFYDNI